MFLKKKESRTKKRSEWESIIQTKKKRTLKDKMSKACGGSSEGVFLAPSLEISPPRTHTSKTEKKLEQDKKYVQRNVK